MSYLKHIELVEFQLEGNILGSQYLPIVEIVSMVDPQGHEFPVVEEEE